MNKRENGNQKLKSVNIKLKLYQKKKQLKMNESKLRWKSAYFPSKEGMRWKRKRNENEKRKTFSTHKIDWIRVAKKNDRHWTTTTIRKMKIPNANSTQSNIDNFRIETINNGNNRNIQPQQQRRRRDGIAFSVFLLLFCVYWIRWEIDTRHTSTT